MNKGLQPEFTLSGSWHSEIAMTYQVAYRSLSCIFLLMLLTACAAQIPPMSPEAAVQSMNAGLMADQALDRFQAHPMQKHQKTHLVVYTGTLSDDGGAFVEVVGYATVKQNTIGWEGVDGSSVGGAPAPQFVAYGTDQLPGAALVFGRVFSERVVAVEATFDTGLVVRAAPKDGVFALVGAQAQTIREVRVLGAADALLQRHQRPKVSNLHDESP